MKKKTTMLKATPLLILLIFTTDGALSQGLGGSIGGSGGISANGHISVLPFDPVGFINFILNIIMLPFRLLEGIFGFGPDSNPLAPCGEISFLPFYPIRFTHFIVYIISLPFRVIGNIFGYSVTCRDMGKPGGSGGGTESRSGGESEGGSGGGSQGESEVSDKRRGIFDMILDIPRGIARFIEEVIHFMRLLHYKTFGDLESGAAYFAGDGEKSQRYREVRNRNVTAEDTAS